MALTFIYVDPEHNLVAVVRWIDNASMDGMVKKYSKHWENSPHPNGRKKQLAWNSLKHIK